MKVSELLALLQAHAGSPFRMELPGGDHVPASFHVTEVGHVQRTFIDCGGTLRHTESCLLQVWLGTDVDHRLTSGKMVKILDIARERGVLPAGVDLDVEVEYEGSVISQYPIASHTVDAGSVILHLSAKHTDCLAKEKCGQPVALSMASTAGACCGPGCCE